ncbi:hypothetical protein GCM10018954_059520 [Kutzneria kofuensis]
MLSVQAELVWQGRLHLGDEPGVYGDAAYSGITLDLPLTLRKTNPHGPDTTVLALLTEGVETYPGYPGHLVGITAHRAQPGDPTQFAVAELTTARLTSADNNSKEMTVDLTRIASPVFLSVRVQVDTAVPPGLYDDFVVTRLSNRSTNYTWVASFGFST